jgi:hypothetical protein
MSVQRYGIPTTFVSTNDPDGPWVLYADHVAALAEARTEGAIAGVTEMAAIRPATDEWREAVDKAYHNGRAEALRDEREACIAVVETVAQSGAYIDYVEIDSVIAAIRARSDGGES